VTTNPIYLAPFQFFGLRESPFHVSPDLRYYMTTAAAEEAFVEFCYGIEMRKGLLVLTGEPGTGKTTLLHRLLQWLREENKSASYVFHYHVNPDDLLQSIFHDFGIVQPSQSKSELISVLGTWLIRRNAAGDSPVVIVDEAQGLSVRALDELRLLLNLENAQGKMLQIVLAGQPELDEKLRRPQLQQLRQRIAVRKKLPLFSLQQCADYIGVRLAVAGKKTQDTFPAETIRAIHACSGGIPRVMNLLCENALISAYAEGEAAVSVEMVRGVAADFDFEFSKLPGDLSSIPLRMGEPAKLDVRRFPALSSEAELMPINFPETNSPRVPKRPTQLTVETRFHQAASSGAGRPRARAVSVGITRTIPLFLTHAGGYFRKLAKSFLRDWNQFLKSVVPLASGHKNRQVCAIHNRRTESSLGPN
jgi:general secretion pathway protein A